MEKALAARMSDAKFRSYTEQVLPMLSSADIEVREVLIPMGPRH